MPDPEVDLDGRVATLPELVARMEWDLTEEEQRLAGAALDDLSEDVRLHGKPSWLTPQTTPAPARSLVLRAAARYLRNPDGYTQSRAGDETVGWRDREDAEVAAFTEREIRMLKQIAGYTGLVSVGVYAWNPGPPARSGYVPTGGGQPFLMYAEDDPR